MANVGQKTRYLVRVFALEVRGAQKTGWRCSVVERSKLCRVAWGNPWVIVKEQANAIAEVRAVVGLYNSRCSMRDKFLA